jgi:hypothetical protein
MLRCRYAITWLVLAVLAGCSSNLETGYEPRRLGSSETERRGYYAAPYSKEAREASQEQAQQSEARKPQSGY